MKAILKNIDCAHYDFNTYQAEVDETAITLTLTIGAIDSSGGDNFDVLSAPLNGFVSTLGCQS